MSGKFFGGWMSVLLVVFMVFGTAAWGDPGKGRVDGPDRTFFGAFDLSFSAAPHLQPRDILRLERNGTVIGEAIVISSRDKTAVVLPTRGLPRAGDETVFVRHSAAVTNPEPYERAQYSPQPVEGTADTEPRAPYTAGDSSYPGPNQNGAGASYGGYGSYGGGGYGYGYGYGYGPYFPGLPSTNSNPSSSIPGVPTSPVMPNNVQPTQSVPNTPVFPNGHPQTSANSGGGHSGGGHSAGGGHR